MIKLLKVNFKSRRNDEISNMLSQNIKFEMISDGSTQTEIQEIVQEFEELLQSR